MTEIETFIKWAHAISMGNYKEAVALLREQQSETPSSRTPLFEELQCLLPITEVWSTTELERCNGKDKVTARPLARLCSFCGLHEDNNRKIIAGPNVFICEKCANNCAQAFSVMK